MAIVADILSQARVYLNDTDSSEYTDTELITYLNDGLGFMENILADNLASVTLKSVYLAASPAILPGDFLKADKAERDGSVLRYKERTQNVADDEYSLLGNELIISDPPVMFYYYSTFPRVKAITDSVDIYKPLETALKEYMVIKALNRLEYNTQEEQGRLSELSNFIVATVRTRDGMATIKRY